MAKGQGDGQDFRFWVDRFMGLAGLSVDEEQIRQLLRYYELLTEWNQRMNLTSIVEPKEAAIKHVVDSVMIQRVVPLDDRLSPLVDVGTGAGMPGLVLKIVCPQVEVVLLDSLRKRLGFLDRVISDLKITGVSTWHARAEDAGRDPMRRETFPCVVARAVAGTSVLLEYCAPLCQIGGTIVAYKGPDVRAELSEAGRAMDVLGVEVRDAFSYDLPEGMGGRTLVAFRKVRETPEMYPRSAGTPSRRPL